MYVQELRLTNFKAFSHLTLPLQAGVNVIYGNNGAGKSSVLMALALNLSWFVARLRNERGSGKRMDDDCCKNGTRLASAAISVNNDGQTITSILLKTRSGLSKKSESSMVEVSAWAHQFRQSLETDHCDIRYPLFVYYSVHRTVLDIPLRIRKTHSFGPLAGYDSAFDDACNFRVFFEWFRNQEDLENEQRLQGDINYKDPSLECVRQTLTSFIPSLSQIRVKRRPLKMIAIKNGDEVSLSQLSDGEKCLLALVGDIARRLSLLNMEQVSLGSYRPLSTSEILNSRGVVLIDELDLHLHPAWQRLVIKNLSKVFPNLQFIVSTHSPQMLSEVDGNRIYAIDGSTNQEEPLSAVGLGKGLSPNEILKCMMQTDALPSELEAINKQISSCIDDERWDEARKLLAEMKALVGEGVPSPTITGLEAEIDLLSQPLE